MHVTGGTLQLEQTELTATQLDTNVTAAGGKKKEKTQIEAVFAAMDVLLTSWPGHQASGETFGWDSECFLFFHQFIFYYLPLKKITPCLGSFF